MVVEATVAVLVATLEVERRVVVIVSVDFQMLGPLVVTTLFVVVTVTVGGLDDEPEEECREMVWAVKLIWLVVVPKAMQWVSRMTGCGIVMMVCVRTSYAECLHPFRPLSAGTAKALAKSATPTENKEEIEACLMLGGS